MPDFDPSPDPSILEKLKTMKTIPARDAHAAARGKAEFLKQAEIIRPAVPARSLWRPSIWSNFFQPKEKRMGTLIALIVSAMIALGGTGATVYAAQGAMPNDPLYAVKILSEDAQVNLTGDDLARANLILDLAQRRAQEIAATNGSNDQVTQREQAQITSALQIAAQLNDDQMNQILLRAQQVLSQTLQSIPSSTPSQVRGNIDDQNQIVQVGLNDPNAFRLQFRHDQPRPSPYPINLPPPSITATVPISGTPVPPPFPGDHRPPFTATIPISGTPAAPPMPEPRGTPPITATLLPKPDDRPPFTATNPITMPLPPMPGNPPPITGTNPITMPLPPIHGNQPPMPGATPVTPPTLMPMPTSQPPPTIAPKPTMVPPATVVPMPTSQQQPPPPPPPPSGNMPPPPMGTPRRP